MTIKGLPPLETFETHDVPFHEQEPNSCKKCTHSFYSSNDTKLRYLRCGRSDYGQQCRYERHETGTCGPAALHRKERAA